MKFKVIKPLKEPTKMAFSRVFTKTVLIFSVFLGSAAILVSCGGGNSSSSSSSSTGETTLVTGANGSSNVTCGTNVQCIGTLFRFVADMPTTLSVASTPWTNTSTNIITISQITYVDGSNAATVYDLEGSIFETFTDPIARIPDSPTPGTRYFFGNGLPSTPMGTFPVQSGTAAYPYYAALPGGTNPATGQTYTDAAAIGISPYPLISSVPLNPVESGYYPIESLIVGITLTGAAWHVEKANDSSGNYYSPINALPNDACFGHPYNQQYHYHAYSWKCFDQGDLSKQSPVYGFALDGFPITGPRGADGRELTNADLDICHGRTSEVTMPDGTKKNTYHYVLNREYPYSVGCFRGKVNYDHALGPPGPNPYMKEGAAYPTGFYPP
jgi:hypothetical protein